jgi:hypothetical protein
VLEPVGFISKTISFFYRASDRPLTILSFKDYHDSSCALFLEGSIVAEVSHVWICRQPGDSSDADCAKNWTQMAIFHDEDEIRGDHGTRLEALARTLCADFREPETGSRYARGCVHKWPEANLDGNYSVNCFEMVKDRNSTTAYRIFF